MNAYRASCRGRSVAPGTGQHQVTTRLERTGSRPHFTANARALSLRPTRLRWSIPGLSLWPHSGPRRAPRFRAELISSVLNFLTTTVSTHRASIVQFTRPHWPRNAASGWHADTRMNSWQPRNCTVQLRRRCWPRLMGTTPRTLTRCRRGGGVTRCEMLLKLVDSLQGNGLRAVSCASLVTMFRRRNT